MDPSTGRVRYGQPSGGTTTAAIWRGGDKVTLEEVSLPEVLPGQTLVRIDLATVCGSDLHTVLGHRPGACPSVLGHEAVGVVVESDGARTVDGSPVQVGDRVIWSVTVGCGECDRCRGGFSAKCRHVRKVGHESFESDWPLSGGYAGHALLPRGSAVAIVPDGLADVIAAPAACATGTVMAVVERAGDLEDKRVLVVGAGMLGLTATAFASAAGAREVLVTDVDADRLAMAVKFGATSTILAGEALPPVDVALEFSGAAVAVAGALAALDLGGTLVMAGSVSPGPAIDLDPERMVRNWLTVAGVHNYEPRHLLQSLEFLDRTQHDRPWADLVSAAVPLTEIGALLVDEERREPRAAVVPTHPSL